MASLAPPPAPPRLGLGGDDGLNRLRLRLLQVAASAVTVVATGWVCTLGVIPAIIGLMVAKHVHAAVLTRLYQLVASTGQLARFVVFGSFVTAKADPHDIDILLLMEDTFDLASVTGEAALVFQHLEAQARFGASVFWTRRSGAMGGERAMIEYWQVRREGGRRGIIEIVGEKS